jgi:transposase-like protein
MNLQAVFCTTARCADKYKTGKGNIVSHGKKRQRCKCKTCGKTFSYRRGTVFEGIRKPEQMMLWVLGLVAWGCPVAAIVAVFELDERTVAAWLKRAGLFAEAFHHQQMRPLDLQQVQVDEIRLKIQRNVVWIAMALAVGSRLWLGAVCSVKRDRHLARHIMICVYNWAKQVALVISFDGWAAYPNACRRVFREPILTGRVGGPRLQAWHGLTLVQIIKSHAGSFSRSAWVLSGSCSALRYLLNVTQGCHTTLNTAYIERLNATFRAHLAPFARRTRCPLRLLASVDQRVFLVGCLYNFCWFHASLGKHTTPAMAAGLSDHRWSLHEFFYFRLRPFWASTV